MFRRLFGWKNKELIEISKKIEPGKAIKEDTEKLKINLRGIMEKGFESREPLPLDIKLIIFDEDGKSQLPMKFKYWGKQGPVETKWKTHRPTYRYILEDEDGTKFSMLSSGKTLYDQSELIPIGKIITLDANEKGWKFFRL
jgi:hypothetical protein